MFAKFTLEFCQVVGRDQLTAAVLPRDFVLKPNHQATYVNRFTRPFAFAR